MRPRDRWSALAALVLGVVGATWFLVDAAGQVRASRVAALIEPVPMPDIPEPPQPRMPDRFDLDPGVPRCTVTDERQCRLEAEEFCGQEGSEVDRHGYDPGASGACVFLCKDERFGRCEIEAPKPQPKPWPKPRGA